MGNEAKKGLILFVILLFVGGAVYIGQTFNKNEDKDFRIENSIGTSTPTSTYKSEEKEGKTCSVFYIDKDGEEVSHVYSLSSNDDYNGIFTEILSKYKNREDVVFQNVKVLDAHKNTDTLYLNMNEEVKSSQFKSKELEKKVIESIIKTYLSIPNKDFGDIQFTINGESQEFCFGGDYNTKNPLKI